MRRAATLFLLYAALAAVLLTLLGTRVTGLPALGSLLDPTDGLYRTARLSDQAPLSAITISGLTDSVRVIWDDRSVPHIFAADPLDAVAALGYVHANHRLFQMDFIPRAASGRLSAALGKAAVESDRFLRRTGMEWGAKRNLARIRRAAGIELEILQAYCRGVNAYLDQLSARDLPFEFRLLGYAPDRCSPLQPMRVLQYMNYDLSYGSDKAIYGWLRQRLSPDDYRLLYPDDPAYSVPIVPPESNSVEVTDARRGKNPRAPDAGSGAFADPRDSRLTSLLEGYFPGKGSNNWAVSGLRSSTGAPILAGDMHLAVTLPAIWYEVHIVTPESNSYGVSIPGAPVLVEAFNDHLGWTFTNTGADQIDHYRLELDSTESQYRFDGAWHDLEVVPDTILVNGSAPVMDTLRYSHWGPVTKRGGEWVAEQWVAHDSSRTLLAVWRMNHARNHTEFQEALHFWDTPMQNILYADRSGIISIRSTGHLPIRRGRSGAGLLDGSDPAGEWIGRVPIDQLPYAENPPRGFLTSTNQKPTDSTYAYYLGHDWGDRTYRSIRIDSLLRSRPFHGPSDLRRFQADVHAVQRDFFVPLIDTLSGLSGRADTLRNMLAAWNGETSLDRREPIGMHYFLEELERLAWDEQEFDAVRIDARGDTLERPVSVPKPSQTRLYYLLTDRADSPWLNIESTLAIEKGADLVRKAMEGAAVGLASSYGWNTNAWVWRERHSIQFNHLIGALRSLGRGPFPYPGYDDTLSPASDTLATHSASWRVVVDFSTSPPSAEGIYPGGQSGNPFSRFYDMHIENYLDFQYFELRNSPDPRDLFESDVTALTIIEPATE